MIEHIRSCGREKGFDHHDIADEARWTLEHFAGNEDLDFREFPRVVISHHCVWVDCDWGAERTVEMIEQPPEGQQTLHEFSA